MERDRQKPAANTAEISAPETVAGNGKPQTPVKAQTTEETEEKHVAITTKLLDLGEKGEELKEAAKDKGLDISGFFDVNAKTDNATDQTFSVGSIELDLEYSYNELLAPTSANQLGKSLSCLVN